VIVTDVDGTLMDSKHKLPAANKEALRRCLAAGVPVVLATGKHRGPWVSSLISQVFGEASGRDAGALQPLSDWTLNAPGVFVQGMLVCNAAGEVVFRNTLPHDVVRLCLDVASRCGWTVLAYTDGDRVLSNRADPQTERLRPLQEPAVEVAAIGGTAVHKMLFLCSPEEESAVRAELAGDVGGKASLTVAIPGMVEVLPLGASKADGVRVALELLGFRPGEALALGDGENDLELLQLVREDGGVAAAVANARPRLKEVATEVVGSCDDGGWAEAVDRWVLTPNTPADVQPGRS